MALNCDFRRFTQGWLAALASRAAHGALRSRFDMTDGVAGGLAAKGIIYRSSNVINLIDGVPHNLQPWARLFLSTHPEVLDDAAQMPPSRSEQWRRRRLTRYESG